MSILSGVKDFFGLDIGTTAVRLVELSGGGATKALEKYAYVPIDAKMAMSDSKSDQQKLAEIIKDLVSQAHVNTRNVAVGLPSQRVFTTVVDFDNLSEAELGKAIRLQADSLIPTPLSDSKMDWSVLGASPADKTKIEVLLSSASNDFIEARLDMLESIGLNVIAFEPDSLAITRSLLAPGDNTPQMILDMGSKSTDLVIVVGGTTRLTRSIPTGSEAIIRSAMQNLNIEEKQAEQFVFKFGLSEDKLEGQVYQAIIGTVELLTAEISKSIKFFTTRYPEIKLERVIVTGAAPTLPSFPLYLANKFAINVEIGNAWRNISFAADRQNELLSISSQFSVAAGLAERNE